MSTAKSIKEQIGFLKELQAIDKEIYALRRQKDNIPLRLSGIEKMLEDKKQGIKEKDDRLKTLQLSLKEKEVNLQQREEHIKKLRIQLYQLKTNKEYSAMLTEIEGSKANNSLVEEEIINLMDDIDAEKKKLQEEKELFSKEEKNAQAEKDVINRRGKEIDSLLSEFYSQREKIVPNIEKGLLARYERVLENKDGLAIVPVQDNACGGCYMNLPPQIVSEAKLKEGIVVCGSCSRILYIDDDVQIS